MSAGSKQAVYRLMLEFIICCMAQQTEEKSNQEKVKQFSKDLLISLTVFNLNNHNHNHSHNQQLEVIQVFKQYSILSNKDSLN